MCDFETDGNVKIVRKVDLSVRLAIVVRVFENDQLIR